ncbi:transcriptional regulatory protein [Candidatus Scalindua japonica]|uniref:Transcriptional regulatory protein n=1 Tax=Candidatus Scalindua japonica TaxID=1284222 RepID=A0A286U4D9_9BACT|nr:sigma-54-dependent Fis family transcriptional regulator [Candidatus Scalindua japonica]GAX63018.1 transcriptional regulatory protein [Candidatus Scalindua japonica]
MDGTTSLRVEDIVRNKNLKETHLHDILEASAIINSKLDLNHVLKQVIVHATRLTNSVAASIILKCDSSDDLVIRYATGPASNAISNVRFPTDKGIAGFCINTGQIVVVFDAKKNPHHFADIDKLSGFNTESVLCVPLCVKGKTIGCVQLLNKCDSTSFNNEDIAVATIMSNFAAVSVSNAKSYDNLQRTNFALKSQLFTTDMVTGKNSKMKKILQSINKLKDTKSNVLILGESGTGKGVIARAIHRQSSRKDNPFVTVNCSVLSPTLLESELFGHEKGAFTGADKLKVGRFEIADSGTVFLDEIGEIDKSIQTKLLRILQEKVFERVGSTKTLTTDIRIIAATNSDLEKAVEQNLFRRDLYYRLKVIVFQLPPLRERREDIPAFAQFFLERYCKELSKSARTFDKNCMSALVSYDYPGNIRELENIVERAVVLAEGDVIHISDLPDEIQYRKKAVFDRKIEAPEKTKSIYEMEKDAIYKTMLECSWNQSMAARLLGLSRDKLRYRIKKYKIEKPAED